VIEARLRAGYDAYNRADYDEAITFYQPDVELHRPGAMTPIVGRDALRAWMEPDAFAEQTIEPLAIEGAGRRRLVRQRTWGRAAGSGIEIDNETWAVVTFGEDDLVARVEIFQLHEEEAARAAAGLPATAG
jgi:hypothetical protein